MGASLAVVEGTLQTPLEIRSCAQSDLPGDLRRVAQTLDLPLVAVLSVTDPDEALRHLPRMPEGVEGVLVDGIRDPDDLPRIRRLLRLTGSPPVLGGAAGTPGHPPRAGPLADGPPGDRRD